ncbi:unnamed protein product [Leuciscus chuanchicus]
MAGDQILTDCQRSVPCFTLMVVFVPRCIVGSLSVFASVDQDGREYFVEGLELNTRRTPSDCDVERPDSFVCIRTSSEDCLPDHLLVSLSSELKKSVILETLSKSNEASGCKAFN